MGLPGMRYKGIVFDFNGVLFWDADLQVKSWQVIAKNLRGHEMTDDELAIHMHGRPNSYVLSYLAGRTIARQELLDLIQVKESFYRELCLSNPRRLVLSPGAHSLLETLAFAPESPHRMCIWPPHALSGSPRMSAQWSRMRSPDSPPPTPPVSAISLRSVRLRRLRNCGPATVWPPRSRA